jgi:tetratricopeptide (TPR) repeat protein
MQPVSGVAGFRYRRFVEVILVVSACLCNGCSQQGRLAQHLARAEQYYHQKQYQEASVEYMNVLKVEPTNRLALRGLGFTYCETGEIRVALPCLLKAEMLDPADEAIRVKIGELFLAMGDKKEARERAMSMLQRCPDNLDALVLWGAGISSSNEAATAIKRVEAVATLFRAQPRYTLTLGLLHMILGNPDAAQALYQEALERLPNSWELHLALGDLYALKQDGVLAVREYQAAAAIAPILSVGRIKLARYYWASGKKNEAKKLLDVCLKQEPHFNAAILCRAEMSFSERDYERAMTLLNGLLKAAPSNLEAFFLMQRVKLAQGRDDEAIAAYTSLVSAFDIC